jgi:hypothetical protein
MSETAQPSPAIKKRITLKEFMDVNDKLVDAMGVMGVLAALFTTIKNAGFLAFLAFAMLLVLDVELVRLSFNLKHLSATLFAFLTLSQFFMGGIAGFLVFIYIIQWYQIAIAFVFGFIIGFGVIVIISRRRKKHIKK